MNNVISFKFSWVEWDIPDIGKPFILNVYKECGEGHITSLANFLELLEDRCMRENLWCEVETRLANKDTYITVYGEEKSFLLLDLKYDENIVYK